MPARPASAYQMRPLLTREERASTTAMVEARMLWLDDRRIPRREGGAVLAAIRDEADVAVLFEVPGDATTTDRTPEGHGDA